MTSWVEWLYNSYLGVIYELSVQYHISAFFLDRDFWSQLKMSVKSEEINSIFTNQFTVEKPKLTNTMNEQDMYILLVWLIFFYDFYLHCKPVWEIVWFQKEGFLVWTSLPPPVEFPIIMLHTFPYKFWVFRPPFPLELPNVWIFSGTTLNLATRLMKGECQLQTICLVGGHFLW